MERAMRVGIVGAGVTGLALTHYLDERGIDSVAYEAADEPGGVIDSRTIDGRVVEVGPQRLRLSEEIETMIDDLGVDGIDLRESLRTADDDLPLYVYADGDRRIVPRSLSDFFTTDLLSWRAKLRVLAEPLTADGSPDESTAELFTRKFGREAYENLVDPILGGTFGSDPARMPAGHALQGVLRLERKRGNLLVPAAERLLGSSKASAPASFDEGLQRFPEALTEAHADRVELGTEVTDADADASDVSLTLDDGRTERFDRVVVTVPAGDAAGLVESIAPESAAAIDTLTYNPLVLVHLVSDANATGFGYQVRRSEPLRTLGVSWNASLFDRNGVYTAFLGGMNDPAVLDLDASEIGEIAAREFERVMDALADVLHVEKMPDAFPAYDDSWDALDRVDLPETITLATNYTARMGIPSRVREAERLAESLEAESDGQDESGESRGPT